MLLIQVSHCKRRKLLRNKILGTNSHLSDSDWGEWYLRFAADLVVKLVRPHSIDTVLGSTRTTMLNCEVDFEIALPRYALKTLPPPPLSLFKI